jgi:hypothetical protein
MSKKMDLAKLAAEARAQGFILVPGTGPDAAPFGFGPDGKALAPFGFKSDGTPKLSPAGRPPSVLKL